jgi:hypothetical protein
LVTRVHAAHGGGFVSRGRPYALGLFRSVALVVCLMRKNLTQQFAGAIFGVSQATVNRRWDLLRPLIAQVLTEFVPDPGEVLGAGTVLVDGTICPIWDAGPGRDQEPGHLRLPDHRVRRTEGLTRGDRGHLAPDDRANMYRAFIAQLVQVRLEEGLGGDRPRPQTRLYRRLGVRRAGCLRRVQ